MEELIKRLERVIATGAPDKDGMHPISAETVLEVVKQLQTAEPTFDAMDTQYNLPIGTDCISRQAAIDAVESELIGNLSITEQVITENIVNDVCAKIRQLPPIQPEPKTGKWILDRSGAYCCSECMEPCASYVMMKPRDKFCKMCGSRNEVTE